MAIENGSPLPVSFGWNMPLCSHLPQAKVCWLAPLKNIIRMLSHVSSKHAIPVIKALLSASSIKTLGQGLSGWDSTCVSKYCIKHRAVFGTFPVEHAYLLLLKLTFGQSGWAS